MNRHDYITLRIINASLRVNFGRLVNTGCITEQDDQQWLVYQAAQLRLRLVVRGSDYMQRWHALYSHWQQQSGYV